MLTHELVSIPLYRQPKLLLLFITTTCPYKTWNGLKDEDRVVGVVCVGKTRMHTFWFVMDTGSDHYEPVEPHMC